MQGSISVTLTKEDLVQLQLSYLFKKPYPYLLGFLYLISILDIVLAIAEKDLSSLNPFMVFIFIFVPLLAFFLIKAHKNNLKNRLVNEERQYTWSDEGVVLESDSLTVRMQWTDFTGLFATKSAIYLMVNGVTAHIFPRRCFTDEQWSEFGHTVRGRIKQKKKLRGVRNLLIYVFIFIVTVGIIQYFNVS
ncbi:YcxB family protein [Paenibacillus sp. ATY16]|uniref:YcxB family protein n=1 Tax=Paenibacillus sp. ATY16 TaxID=1759312 RepID=UPI00200FB293|nr:YcxB family protein [Paenibacillus sp. ATY16]MCK9858985.1 YcxB family protein [Paenibacillus sp. ATY16]